MWEVLNFISNRFPVKCNWTNGNCYYFALILHDRFPNSAIYYDVIHGHFLTKIGDNYFDWLGVQYPIENDLVRWDEYQQIDPVHYNRIKRDVLS